MLRITFLWCNIDHNPAILLTSNILIIDGKCPHDANSIKHCYYYPHGKVALIIHCQDYSLLTVYMPYTVLSCEWVA